MIVNRPNVDKLVAPEECASFKNFPEFYKEIQKNDVNNKKNNHSKISRNKDEGMGR